MNSGDIQKLMSHIMKLWKRMIENKLRHEITILENQFGFMPRQSIVKLFSLLKRLMEN